jgi:cell division transport system ATP-binding protein
MITFQNVSKFYPPRIAALQNINFKVSEGDFLSITGRSGAGKTTLLKLILAEEIPSAGRVLFAGRDVGRIKRSKLPALRRKIGAIFQNYELLNSKTIYENVAFVLEVVGAAKQEIAESVPRVLALVGLEERMASFPCQLSAGERQRAAIARALVHRPQLLLADEPTGSLDPYNTSEIIELLLKINKIGTTVVLASHDKEIIKRINGRVIVLDQGRIVGENEKGEFVL